MSSAKGLPFIISLDQSDMAIVAGKRPLARLQMRTAYMLAQLLKHATSPQGAGPHGRWHTPMLADRPLESP